MSTTSQVVQVHLQYIIPQVDVTSRTYLKWTPSQVKHLKYISQVKHLSSKTPQVQLNLKYKYLYYFSSTYLKSNISQVKHLKYTYILNTNIYTISQVHISSQTSLK